MLFYSICAAWVIGILLARALPLDELAWLALVGLAALALILFRKNQSYRVIFGTLLVMLVGAVRLQLQLPAADASQVSFFNDLRGEVRLTGVIVNDSELRETYTRLIIRVERIRIPQLETAAPVDGTVLVYASRLQEWSYGDWVRINGELGTPPTEIDFDFARVLANQGIYSWMPTATVDLLEHGHGNPVLAAIYRLRAHFLRGILRTYPDPEAQLMAGILLGVESGISRSTRDAFNRTGTTHIIAISGFNLTLLAQASMKLSGRWLGRRRGAIAAIALILAYSVMVGADPPVVRAAVMASLGLIAGYLGRVSQALQSLGLAAIVMTFINPLTIYEVGFQLSFAATIGLILYADPLLQGARRVFDHLVGSEASERLSPFVAEFALFTLAAQLTTLPITAVAFHRLSLVSILANIFVLPLQPALMLSGGLAMMLTAISLPLGQVAAWIAWPFPSATIGLVQAFASLPAGSLQLKPLSFLFPLTYYLGLFGITFCLKWFHGRKADWMQKVLQSLQRRLSALPVLTLLFIAALLSWHAFLRRPDGRLHLTVFDVGSGEAVLIRAPGGGSLLINGGSSSLRLSEQMSPHFSLFDHHLDWLLLAGDGYSQLAGLIGLQDRYPATQVLLPSAASGSTVERVLEELNRAGIPIITARAGMGFDLGDGASLKIIEASDTGLAFSLEYGSFRSMLLPGSDPELIEALTEANRFEDWAAILLPACGDPRVLPPELLTRTSGLLLMSCGAGEGAGLIPTTGQDILRTDLNGDIELISDGHRLSVTVERQP